MKKRHYLYLIQFFSNNPKRKKAMQWLTKYSPIPVMIAYALGTLDCVFSRSPYLWTYLGIPLCAIMIVTIFRKTFYIPRPFIQFGFEPLLAHEDSSTFPSKHTTSAFIISYAIARLNLYAGILLFLLAIIIGLTRIISGIHRPLDILSGFVIATLLSFFL